MATSSIFSNVRISNAKQADVFAMALEKAAANSEKQSRSPTVLSKKNKKAYDSFMKSRVK